MKKEEEIVKLEEMLFQNFNDFYNPEVKEVFNKLTYKSWKRLFKI
jgi:hypothetical protein